MTASDRERAIKAIRRGVPLGEVVQCSCHTNPPTRNGCYGVCEDSVAAIIASYEDLRREAALTAALSDQVGGWQDISTAPKYDDVLVWVPFQHGGGMRQIARYDHKDGGWIDDNDDKMTDAYKPTHWQPLPAPPPASPAVEVG